jgi:hypothetical protein
MIAMITNLYGVDVGGALKEIGFTHWDSPNTGATNDSGFTGLGGGRAYVLAPAYNDPSVYFTGINKSLYLWYDEAYAGGEGYVLRLNHDSADYWLGFVHQANISHWYCSVRFIKD